MKTYITQTRLSLTTLTVAAALAGSAAIADVVHLDDVIVDGSACIGFDCVNGESFGFDTLRLKENNLRIAAQDTSTAASFPSNDWQITFNDSANGGLDKFSIDDISGGRTPFTIEAGARSHSLYVDDGGRVGLRTSTPSTELHMVDGDTPTVRLQQDGSSGFNPQTWDMAGNETSFFIRDVTNGSKLPFRIRPDAPGSSIDIASDGNVGVGASSPDAALHVRRTNGEASILVEEASGTVAGRTMLTLKNNGPAFFRIENTALGADERWVFSHDAGGNLGINRNGATNEFLLDASGNLTITGSVTTTGGTCGGGCDAVFGADYDLLTIAEYGQQMWENKYLPNVGPTLENAPINLSDKLGRMLNALEHAHIYIGQQDSELQTAQQRISTLETRLEALESKLN